MDRRSFEFMLATPSGRVDSVPEDVLLDFWPVGGLAVEVTSVFVDSDTKVNKRFDDHVRDDVRREAPDERGFIDVTELAETLTDERRRASLLVLRSDTDDGSIVPENAVKFSEEEEQKGRDRIAALAKILRVSPLFIMGIDEDDETHGYYTDPAVAEMANQIKDDPDVRILLDAKKNLSKQDMDIVVGMVKSLLDKERR